jgi:hypothetical protein
MSTAVSRRESARSSTPPTDDRLRLPVRLARLLALASLAACSVTLVPGVLTGVPVMNGSARGTAVVGLVAATTLLLVAPRAVRGSLRALAVTTGLSAYLLYNAVMFAFATPFNRAFLLYELMLGLALAAVVVQVLAIARCVTTLEVRPRRWVAVYFWAIVGLNAMAWLTRVVPALVDDKPADLLEGSGLTTNPVFVQDLAFWLPVIAWLGLQVWRARPAGTAVAAAAATYWVAEAVSVAVDQWLGHAADPTSEWASTAVVPMFVVLAVAGVLPMVVLMRSLPSRVSDGPVSG